MKYFIDCEFIEDGKTIDLISIGIVAEDGREFYAQNLDCDMWKASDWVKENVFPHLQNFTSLVKFSDLLHHWNDEYQGKGWYRGWLRKLTGDLKIAIIAFIGADPKPEFWGYYADYDWVIFCQLFGTMMDLPKGFPMFCNDLRQALNDRGYYQVTQPDNMPHNALSDARWIRGTYLELCQSGHLAAGAGSAEGIK